jgi:hypothetical protein
MGKLEVKIPFGRSKRKWENNIEADLKRNTNGMTGLDLFA